MKTSTEIKEIAIAICNAQVELNNPKKTEYNEFYKSYYASLDGIIADTKPVLKKHGLSIIQTISGDGYIVKITTRLIHVSGEWIEDKISIRPLEAVIEKDYNTGVKEKSVTPQTIGQAITYMRRYAICAILNINGEHDDDANIQGMKDVKQNKPQQKQKQISTPPKPISDENKKIYGSCIMILNENIIDSAGKKFDIFTGDEKIQYKKNLDAVKMDKEKIISFFENLQTIKDSRVESFKE